MSQLNASLMQEMEEEAQKLRQFTEEAENQNAVRDEPLSTSSSRPAAGGDVNEDEAMEEDPAIVDSRSVYVGNVHRDMTAA